MLPLAKLVSGHWSVFGNYVTLAIAEIVRCTYQVASSARVLQGKGAAGLAYSAFLQDLCEVFTLSRDNR